MPLAGLEGLEGLGGLTVLVKEGAVEGKVDFQDREVLKVFGYAKYRETLSVKVWFNITLLRCLM